MESHIFYHHTAQLRSFHQLEVFARRSGWLGKDVPYGWWLAYLLARSISHWPANPSRPESSLDIELLLASSCSRRSGVVHHSGAPHRRIEEAVLGQPELRQ